MRARQALLACLMLLGGPVASAACGPEVPCRVPLGEYRAAPPPGWSGEGMLAAAIYFHGWQDSAAGVMGNSPLRAAFADAGVLLIAPDGLEGSWAHQGSPSDARDEILFLDQVREDVLRRWPVDEGRLWLSGFSQGGSMAWDLACRRGADYAAVAPVAGAFWEPLPEECPGGPVPMRHVHGFTDRTVPLEGRPIRQVFHQGDVFAGLDLWRGLNGCDDRPDAFVTEGNLHCRIWSACGSGHEVRFCLHPGGHVLPDGFVAGAWGWVREVTGGRP